MDRSRPPEMLEKEGLVHEEGGIDEPLLERSPPCKALCFHQRFLLLQLANSANRHILKHGLANMPANEIMEQDEAVMEMDRRAHVGHELSIQGIGCLFVGIGLPLLIGAGISFANQLIAGNGQETSIGLWGLLFATFIFWSGTGLQRLLFVHAVAASLVVFAALFAFIPAAWRDAKFLPFVLLPAYMLWLILGRRGRRVLSPDYRELIESTPQVRQLSSPWLVAILILLCLAAMMSYIQNSGFAKMERLSPGATKAP
ncbi:MAG: hypothetical protein JNG86_17610 [Verrucomicrobiaceae bacterium]|nr:hypothetical protein [Verrucomicrobiaceae bacterium]